MFLVPVTRSASDLARSFDRLFDDNLDRFFGATGTGTEGALRTPSLDVAETERGYNVSIDLPGVAKEDVKITIEGRHVQVSARSQREETKKEGERVIYRERASSSFARTFTLPEEVDQESSQAKLENGVLSLSLAKKRVVAAKQLTIN
jgi:HSP20 family protein